MIIHGEDFELKKEGHNLVLYLKNKDNKMKVFGYYTKVVSAIKAVRRYRLYKKYPFKYSHKELTAFIKEYEEVEKRLNVLSRIVYRPITKLIKDKIEWQMYG